MFELFIILAQVEVGGLKLFVGWRNRITSLVPKWISNEPSDFLLDVLNRTIDAINISDESPRFIPSLFERLIPDDVCKARILNFDRRHFRGIGIPEAATLV